MGSTKRNVFEKRPGLRAFAWELMEWKVCRKGAWLGRIEGRSSGGTAAEEEKFRGSISGSISGFIDNLQKPSRAENVLRSGAS